VRCGAALSDVEASLLGTRRLRRDGNPSAHPWPDAAQWPAIRAYLVSRSVAANPLLDPELTAYSPGETLWLLERDEVVAWQDEHAVALPACYRRVVLVPCAKTKPWTGEAVRRSRLYSAYNTLSQELDDTCFVTVSEPLGVVPQHRWGDFLQYDNPGLFKDDAQRSGMTTAQWLASPFGICYAIPFDAAARAACLVRLGKVLGRFLAANRDRELYAFVDERNGPPSTHALMLDQAVQRSGVPVLRHPKRAVARHSPLGAMRSVLCEADRDRRGR
jgi:hypothetical protein